MTVAMGALGVSLQGAVNSWEIGGEHGGLTFTFVNTVSNLMGILAPLVCGMLTDSLGVRAGFTAAFWLTAGLNVIGLVVFVTFVSVDSEQQLDRKQTETGSNEEETITSVGADE